MVPLHAAAESIAPPTEPSGPGPRLTTGRRLLLAFGGVVAGFGLAVAFTWSRLVNVGGALDEIQGHEERIRLSLQLESSLRDLAAHQAQVAAGDPAQLRDYLEARERSVDVARRLALQVGEADERVRVDGVVRAADERDRIYRERMAATARSGDEAAAIFARERAYALITSVEGDLDDLASREHAQLIEMRGDVRGQLRSTVRGLAYLLGLAALFSAAMGGYLHRAVARPLARLREGARRLSRGELETRIELRTRDEFAVLAAQLNGMAAAVKLHQDRLVQTEKLASLGRLAAAVAHEIMSPLTVMLGYLMLHRRRNAQGPLAKDMWVVEQEALRCKQIVEDLLEFSRPPRPRERVPVDMRSLCDRVVTSLRGSLDGFPRQVEVHGSGTALGEASRLTQVLLNLVRNAAEAAGCEGQVSIVVAASRGAVEVAVTDSGPGIGPGARARLFEPFFTTKRSGTGLGLAVSRAIAVAHGGDLALRDARGSGAVFALTLPGAGAEGA
ncbi:MAG: sensor histidine kinase [Anaeromyxobacteraceae bacterium]